jgi:hypothetical protein
VALQVQEGAPLHIAYLFEDAQRQPALTGEKAVYAVGTDVDGCEFIPKLTVAIAGFFV